VNGKVELTRVQMMEQAKKMTAKEVQRKETTGSVKEVVAMKEGKGTCVVFLEKERKEMQVRNLVRQEE
jgi:hypothetical protein